MSKPQNDRRYGEINLNDLTLIYVDFDIWSGQTRLRETDLKVDPKDLPPSTLASLGTKRICAPGCLKGFGTLKQRARRAINDWGKPFLGGYVVPSSKLDAVIETLESVEVEFEQLKSTFLSGYYDAVQNWMSENPEYADVIEKAAPSSQEVGARIAFDWQVMDVAPVNNENLNAKLKGKVKGIGDDLIDEVVETAGKFWTKVLHDDQGRLKNRLSVSTYETLNKLRNKIDGLSFLNGYLSPLVDLIDETLAGYQANANGGYIDGTFLYQVMATVLILSDREKIESRISVQQALEEVTAQEYGSEAATPEVADSAPSAQAPDQEAVASPQLPATSEPVSAEPVDPWAEFEQGLDRDWSEPELNSEEPPFSAEADNSAEEEPLVNKGIVETQHLFF